MRMRRKDKGFTLIEVVIAIAILAIALAPLTANFIASSKMNVKSRKNLNAMNLAQDIMEGMRGYSAEDVRGKLRNANATSLVGNILPKNTTYVQSGCTVDETSTPYKYKIDNVTPADGNLNTYDVEIELTPDTTVYTGKDMASISSIDQYFDATYTMSETPEDTESVAAKDIYDRLPENKKSTSTESDVKSDLKREIILEVKKTGIDLNGNETYASTVEVKYYLKNPASWGMDATTGVYPTTAISHNISKAEATVCPNSVYLYYTGLLNPSNTTTGGSPSLNDDDKIIIKNTSGKNVSVYLIRTQKEAESVTNAAYNSAYKCRIDIIAQREDTSLPTPTLVDVDLTSETETGKVFLVTNARHHLTFGAEDNIKNQKEDGTPIAGISSQYKSDRADIYYNSTTAKVSDQYYTNKTKDPSATYPSTYIYDGYQKSDEGLLYNVKLIIKDKDDGTKTLATYEGGTIN